MKSVSPANRNEACIVVCNRLLGGELAAVGFYGQTIRKYEGDPVAGVLRQVRDEHERAAELLRGHVLELGGTPVTEPGAWGVPDESPEGLAAVFESPVFKELQRSEEWWCGEHREALKDEAMLPGCKELIRFELLPRSAGNIDSLQSLSTLTLERCGDGLFAFAPAWR